MTSFDTVNFKCPNCGHQTSATILRSICTWLNPGLAKSLHDHGQFVKCPECEVATQIRTTVLINCPRKMFWLDTGQNLWDLRYRLYEAGIVGFEGEVVNLGPEE